MRLRRHDTVWLLAVVSLLLSGAGANRPSAPAAAQDAVGHTPRTEVPSRDLRDRAPVSPAEVRAPTEPRVESAPLPRVVEAPVRVRIPVLGVDAEVGPLGTTARGELEVPSEPDVAGWWADGVPPGAHGPAVIAGHVDWTDGPAVFFRLSELRAGDAIEVEGRDGDRLSFTVTEVLEVPKDEFPTAMVYGPTEHPTLRLITCGGPFERAGGRYLHNVVVTAEWTPTAH